jgi:hypothetical protein
MHALILMAIFEEGNVLRRKIKFLNRKQISRPLVIFNLMRQIYTYRAVRNVKDD